MAGRADEASIPTIGYRTDFRDVGDGSSRHVNLMFELLDDFVSYSGDSIAELATLLHQKLTKHSE